MITQLYTTIDIALLTRSQPGPCSSHVSDSMFPPPHRPTVRRLPNTSLIWLAGGMAGGTFSDTGSTVVPGSHYIIVKCDA